MNHLPRLRLKEVRRLAVTRSRAAAQPGRVQNCWKIDVFTTIVQDTCCQHALHIQWDKCEKSCRLTILSRFWWDLPRFYPCFGFQQGAWKTFPARLAACVCIARHLQPGPTGRALRLLWMPIAAILWMVAESCITVRENGGKHPNPFIHRVLPFNMF